MTPVVTAAACTCNAASAPNDVRMWPVHIIASRAWPCAASAQFISDTTAALPHAAPTLTPAAWPHAALPSPMLHGLTSPQPAAWPHAKYMLPHTFGKSLLFSMVPMISCGWRGVWQIVKSRIPTRLDVPGKRLLACTLCMPGNFMLDTCRPPLRCLGSALPAAVHLGWVSGSL